MGFGIAIGLVQIVFAFLCIAEVKRQGRLNKWWVLAAALLGLFAYVAALLIRRPISTDHGSDQQ
jgi:RsiW-degrading membrane proteinase PrsW (M82 family)